MRPDRAARLHAATDRAFGEDVVVTPVKLLVATDQNGRRQVDQDRQAVTVQAVWTSEWAERLPVDSGTNGTTYRGASTTRPAIKLGASALPWPPAIGMRVQRVATGEKLTVASVRPDGFGRLVLGLSGGA